VELLKAMNSPLDGTTLATYMIAVSLLRKLWIKQLLSTDEVTDMLDCAMLECEGLDVATAKAGRRLLEHVRSLVLQSAAGETAEAASPAISRRAA
jgi:hypothetical protein